MRDAISEGGHPHSPLHCNLAKAWPSCTALPRSFTLSMNFSRRHGTQCLIARRKHACMRRLRKVNLWRESWMDWPDCRWGSGLESANKLLNQKIVLFPNTDICNGLIGKFKALLYYIKAIGHISLSSSHYEIARMTHRSKRICLKIKQRPTYTKFEAPFATSPAGSHVVSRDLAVQRR